MTDTRRGMKGRGAEAGFTLVEALVAIVVLIFGLMAVTNLMLVAASSNSVANQGTAAVASATRAMDMVKATTFASLVTGGDVPGLDTCTTAGKNCSDATLAVADWHCTDNMPGVGSIHTHWQISPASPVDLRLVHVQVRSEGKGALSGARSRADFTTFRACTNAEAGACPAAP